MAFLKSLGKSIIAPVKFGKDVLFPKQRDAAAAAMPYLNQIPGIGREAYNPYIQQGQVAQQQANPIYGNMAEDPMSYLNEILSGYKPSTGYQFREGQALKEARNAAASGGFSGTEYDQDRQAELVNSLMGEDMQQFLQNVLGIQGGGLAGLEQQAGRGFEASHALADLLGGTLGSQAGLQFQGVQNRNQGSLDKRNGLFALIAQALKSSGGKA